MAKKHAPRTPSSNDAQVCGFATSKPGREKSKKQKNTAQADLSPSSDEALARKQEVSSWQRPDWKKQELYPVNDSSLSDDEWRWEFLRRDEGYQQGYIIRPGLFPFDYGLTDWVSPAQNSVPKFLSNGGHVIELEKEPIKQFLQYQSWVTSQPSGRFFLFMVDVEYSLKSQISIIEDEYKRRTDLFFCCKEKKINLQRKNNQAPKKSRPRPLLLRILDASYYGASPDEIGSQFSIEGHEAIGESSIRKAIDFAEDFWKRF